MIGSITWLVALMADKGTHRYGLHAVTQLQHALQSALFAEQSGGAAALITAALLHDIGHMVHDLGDNPAADGVDDRHEAVGHDFLVRYFPADVTEPIRLHVAAKRYLCAIEPAYADLLSPDSVLSLKLQGGAMSPAEVTAFRAEPHAEMAVRLRRFDDAAKVKDLATPGLDHFVPYLAQCHVDAPAPMTQAPLTQAPLTRAPLTQAPMTQAPMTEAPMTEAPATRAPAALAT
jgi:phosphonate degradation associated HDIG domain protein